MSKIFTIILKQFGRGQTREPREVVGDLPTLQKYFDYTLECGQSWNPKIKRQPKTIKSFIKNLQMSYEEKEASCYTRTLVSLKTPEPSPSKICECGEEKKVVINEGVGKQLQEDLVCPVCKE